MTFVDNGNGTATLSGTAGVNAAGVYHLSIAAANGIGSGAVQAFTLNVSFNADLSVSLTNSTASTIAGGYLTYTVTVSNLGPTLAQKRGAQSAARRPDVHFAGAGIGHAIRPEPSTSQVLDSVASLPANSSATFNIMVRVPVGTATGTGQVTTAYVTSPTYDPIPGNNAAATVVMWANAGAS